MLLTVLCSSSKVVTVVGCDSMTLDTPTALTLAIMAPAGMTIGLSLRFTRRTGTLTALCGNRTLATCTPGIGELESVIQSLPVALGGPLKMMLAGASVSECGWSSVFAHSAIRLHQFLEGPGCNGIHLP